jgi:hypothetical protein
MKFLLYASVAFGSRLEANPIRRVVNMLQAMQKKCEEEGRAELDLYEKFVCYCKNNTGELTKSIAEAQQKISQLDTQVNEDSAAKAQLDEELKNHKADRAEATEALNGATKIREKDADTYAKESGDTSTNVAALGKAINAIEKGLSGGAFLQTYASEAKILSKIVTIGNLKLSEIDRQSLTEFLSNSETAPGSSEILGILKEMKDEMSRDYKDLVEAEESAIKIFNELKAAKLKEIAAATRAIEKKTQRSGELAVKIVEGKNDTEDTKEALSEDEQFQLNLRRDCASKEKEQNERVKIRAEEIQALSETIKILNDDDALDLFNKTMKKPRSVALLQEQSTMKSVALKAHNIISGVSKVVRNVGLDLITLALRGKKVDFSKVLKMIDDMVVVLENEQKEDDEHREYCNKEFDSSDDKKKEIQRRIEDLTHEKEEAQNASAMLAKEIAALQAGIKALDKSVTQATEQRKNEHAEFVSTSANNQAALDLIAFAKNRLNKFYNPKMYKAPPPRELTEEERVYSNFGGEVATAAPTGIAGTDIGRATFLQLRRGAPPPPPETFGAYSKKSSESGGVMAMIDLLSNDLKKEMTVASTEEKNSQEDYEELMADSQKKRAADTKSITTKESAKAEADGVAQTATENLDASNAELYATKEYIANLHKSCDFLIENYDFRKSARATERDALKKAKAVLKGADYSFLQIRKDPCDCIGKVGCACERKTTLLQKFQETPCITMCREMNQYPHCQCPSYKYDATPDHMTFDELFTKFDELIESGRQMLKSARANP